MISKESAVILTSNDPFAGIIFRALLEEDELEIKQVYFESERMGRESGWRVFWKVVKKSGFRYAWYQAIELIGYGIILKFLTLLGKPKIQLPKDFCSRYGIKIGYLTNEGIKNKSITFPEADYLLCIRFSKILKEHILKMPTKVAINFHGALLPKYAGLGSIFQAIYHREQYIGGSFHTMVEKIDAGKVVSQSKFEIDYSKSVAYHHLKVYHESSKHLGEAIKNFNRNIVISKDSEENEYYSFPDREHIKRFKGRLIQLSDFIVAAKLFYNLKI